MNRGAMTILCAQMCHARDRGQVALEGEQPCVVEDQLENHSLWVELVQVTAMEDQ
jgi:hypothetical protein